jgi:hypothetical protein
MTGADNFVTASFSTGREEVIRADFRQSKADVECVPLRGTG